MEGAREGDRHSEPLWDALYQRVPRFFYAAHILSSLSSDGQGWRWLPAAPSGALCVVCLFQSKPKLCEAAPPFVGFALF